MRVLAAGLAMTALVVTSAATSAQIPSSRVRLNTLGDISRALHACWQWPPISEARSGMELTLLVSFKRNGEIFGARVTYETPHVSDEERAVYHGALLAAMSRCSPLPLSDSLGQAIAGRPLHFHIHDTRQQRKA